MKKTFVTCLIAAFAVATLSGVVYAKKVAKEPVYVEVTPRTNVPLPADLQSKVSGLQGSAAAADTFNLHFENFDDGTLSPYVATDFTAQLGTFFHVADATELNGGIFGSLAPLAGAKSMWCGVSPTSAVPFCGWANLPGYGNDWYQTLTSSPLGGDSVVVTYKIYWDSEPGYDNTQVEWTHNAGATWTAFPVTDSLSSGPGLYDGTGLAPFMTETFGDRETGGNGAVSVRFKFQSDGAWSGEDGLWPTDGGVIVDDINIVTRSGNTLIANNTETFEGGTVGSTSAGIWSGGTGPVYGDYAALYPGVSLLQEDPCLFVPLFVVAFFDDPATTNYACHIPDPRTDIGAMPYGNAEGVYMDNEIVSPVYSNTGYGVEFRLTFLTYRDLPLDNLQFYYWRIRSWTGATFTGGVHNGDGCPLAWRNDNFVYYGGQKDWLTTSFSIGPRVTASASGFQHAVGAVDMCGVWCGTVGSGDCHSHAPLLDEVRVQRVGVSTPQYNVRHLDGLFQDNFAENGTLTGTSRADGGTDILPATSLNNIIPADSTSVVITPVNKTGSFPNAHVYVSLQNANHGAISGAALGSTHVRTAPQPDVGAARYPFIGTTSLAGKTWSIFRMDQAYTALGAAVQDRYCVDLNDNLFVPGDTVHYFYAADADATPNNGNEGYYTRTLNGAGGGIVYTSIGPAAASPCEFTILPAGGYNAGGDILYVDDQDDRGGPGQLFFDSALDMLGLSEEVDRFDVLAPSSVVDNSLASRVKDNVTQIVNIYEHILWDSGDLSSGLVGDGTGAPEKSNDWGLLFTFLNTGTLGNGPGLYLCGDDMAEEWATLGGAGPIQVKSTYMNFDLLSGSHIFHGESVSPHMTATGSSFIHLGVPDELIAYGGCFGINDFDVVDPTGTSITEYPYPTSGDGAVISMSKLNSNNETAVVVLSGYSYTFTRDASETPGASSKLNAAPPVFPPARVEFLRDLFIKLGKVVGTATGVKDGPQYANALSNNYPNPFNPTTTIRYSIKERAHVSLKVYNVAGQLVRTLVDEVQAPDAIQPVTWDGSNDAGQTVSSGVYFYKLVTKNFSQTKKMVLLK
jgi:hypothetical protein